MALDEATGRLVLFGGGRAHCSGNRNDTWEFDGTNWQQIPASGPPGREDAGMAYDSARDRMVLFGGFVGGRLGDTWEYQDGNWQEVPTSSAPSPRSAVGMTYDPNRGKVILFGGSMASGALSDQTWEYDGTWTQVHPMSVPAPRWGTRLVAAPSLGGVLLYGGAGVGGVMLNDTWLFDGQDWTQLAAGPGGRYYHQLAYDAGRDRVVLFGGIRIESGYVIPQNDTWEFAGGSWVSIDTGSRPPRTWTAGMAYLPSVGGLVMFGGNEPYQCDSSNATWTYVSDGDTGPPPPPPDFATTLFSDDFDDGNADGWAEENGTWEVDDGAYRSTVPCGAPPGRPGASRAMVGEADWSDYRLDVDFVGLAGKDREIAWRYQDEANHYLISFPEHGAIYVHRISRGGNERWYEAVDPLYNGESHHVTIVAEGDRFRVYLDGQLVHDVVDAGTPLTTGGITLYSGFSPFCPTTIAYDNVVVTSESGSANRPPVADAGGPYGGDEGAEIAFDGAASADPDASDQIDRYEWDFDYDGTTFDVDLDDTTPSAIHTYTDDGVFVVALRVTDGDGSVSEIASAEVTIANVAPGLTVSGRSSITEGATYELTLDHADPGADMLTGWHIDWGDGAVESFPGDATIAAHVYPDGRITPAIAASATDEDGTFTATPALLPVIVVNGKPSAQLVTPTGSVAPGGTFDLALIDATDPSPVDLTAGFTYAFDCGDGSGYSAWSSASSVSCNTGSGGVLHVRGRLRDKDGGTQPYATTVAIATSPTVVAAAAQAAGEGIAKSFALGSFTDPDDRGPWAVSVDWGDGTNPTSFIRTGQASIGSKSHRYADDGNYTVAVTITDADGYPGGATFVVTIANADPIVAGPTDQTAKAGTEKAFKLGSFDDDGTGDAPWSVTIDWGEGSAATILDRDATGTLGTAPHSYASAGTYTVTVTVVDKDGGSGNATFEMDVTAWAAPTVDAPADQSTSEGVSVSFALGAFADADGDGPWSVAVDWGDGSAPSIFAKGGQGSLGNRAHKYADEGAYTVTVFVTDQQGLVGTAAFAVAVVNAAPGMNAPADQTARAGVSKQFRLGSFSDAGREDDPWGVTVDWGDGTATTTFEEGATGGLGSKPHTYTTAGTYEVTVAVVDGDGEEDTATFTVTVS